MKKRAREKVLFAHELAAVVSQQELTRGTTLRDAVHYAGKQHRLLEGWLSETGLLQDIAAMSTMSMPLFFSCRKACCLTKKGLDVPAKDGGVYLQSEVCTFSGFSATICNQERLKLA